MTTTYNPSTRTVLDPHDHQLRPFCDSIGKLFALAMKSKRYLRPTPEEDVIWQANGRILIEEAQIARVRAGIKEEYRQRHLA